jgi:hypothetical protein
LGSNKGYGFFGESKPLKRGSQADKVSFPKRKSGKAACKGSLITKKEKSSEGKSPRVLETEKGFQGSFRSFIKLVERVAKP